MKLILIMIVSYTAGNFLTASLVGRLFYKRTITSEGSGNPGARNAGRVLGKRAFVCTFIGDACKGAFAVMLAKWLGGSDSVQLAALLAVIAGHIFPVIYRFRGGKGISAFIGGLACFQPFLAGCLLLLFLLIYVFIKSFTLAGLGAIFIIPVAVYGRTGEIAPSIIAAAIVCLLGFAHYTDLQNLYREKGK